MFDVWKKSARKQFRFRRPEFQRKLKQARQFQRKTDPVPEGFWARVLQRLGLGSIFSRAVATIVLLVVVYFLTISQTFLVRAAVVHNSDLDNSQISEALHAMEQHRVYLIPSNHMVLLTKARLLRALQNELPQIRGITSFKRELPNKIELSLELRQPKYVWHAGQDYYLLDQDGVVFQKILDYQLTAYPEVLITDQTGEPVQPGQHLDVSGILNFVDSVETAWPQTVTQTSVQGFSLPGSLSLDIFIKTGIGFSVYFDLGRSVKTQLSNLALLLNQAIKPETYAGLSYIDLRLATTAYYCYKDAPCAPENATSTSPIL
jgi:hypothetical protein